MDVADEAEQTVVGHGSILAPAAALTLAHGWVGTISPSNVATVTTENARALPFYQVALTALKNAVARPSAATGANYGQASSDVQTRVGEVLSGSATASAALSQLQTDLVNLTGFSTGSP